MRLCTVPPIYPGLFIPRRLNAANIIHAYTAGHYITVDTFAAAAAYRYSRVSRVYTPSEFTPEESINDLSPPRLRYNTCRELPDENPPRASGNDNNGKSRTAGSLRCGVTIMKPRGSETRARRRWRRKGRDYSS